MVFINRRQRSRFVEDIYLRFTFKNKTQTCSAGDKMCHTRIRLVLYSPCVRVDVYKFVLRYVYAFFFYFDCPPLLPPCPQIMESWTRSPKLRVLILQPFFVLTTREQLLVLHQDYGRTSFSNYRRQSQNTNIKPFLVPGECPLQRHIHYADRDSI